MSTIIDIADAVVTELNGGFFSQPFTAQRHYRPVFDLKDMADLHVTVVPRGVELSAAGRALTQSDVQIDLGVQKKLLPNGADSTGDLAEIDALMGLVQEIIDFLRCRRLSALPAAAWVRAENSPIFAPEHLEQYRQFTSVITLTYRVIG